MAATAVEDIYDLSPMQQGMLFHALLSPGTAVYQDQFHCVLRGPMDCSAYRQAWTRVVERHAALRTSYSWERRDKLLQVVLHSVALPYREENLSELAEDERKLRIEHVLNEDRSTGFNLARGPLFRIHLLHAGAQVHHLIVSYHHIIMDGWSGGIILKESLDLYHALCTGQEPLLAAVHPFRDYIVWLRQKDKTAAAPFFQRYLSDLSEPTHLPIDRGTSGKDSSGEPQQLAHELSQSLSQELTALCQKWRITLNTLIQGAWAVLLYRYTGERSVTFGVTSSGRPSSLPGVETMIGLFINTLPARITVDPQAAIGPWLQQLMQTQQELREFEHCSLSEIQDLSPIRRPLPLFESLLVMQNMPIGLSALARLGDKLRITDFRIWNRISVPLSVMVTASDSIALSAVYDAQRFFAADIESVLAHLESILQGFVTHCGGTIGDIPILTERSALLALGQGPPLPPSAGDTSLPQLLLAQASRTPEAIAIICGDEQLTYRELFARAGQLSRVLQEKGAGPERLVGLFLRRTSSLLVAMLAVHQVGSAYVPLDPAYPRDRIAWILQDAAASLVLCEAELQAVLPPSAAEVLCLDGALLAPPAGSPALPPPLLPHHPAYVIYTSGSTGKPKGVVIEQRNVTAFVHWALAAFSPAELRMVLASTSICFDLSIFEIFVTLCAGGTVLLAENALALPSLRQAQQVTLINTVPSAMAALLDMGGLPSALRTVNLAGEPLHLALCDQIYAAPQVEKIYNLYGPTETTTYSTFALVPRGGRPTIGRPIAGTRVYVVDADLHLQPMGLTGELLIGGAGVARGYRHRDDLTATRFCALADADLASERVYRTGDMVRWLPSGELEFCGRRDHQIKLRGFRIELEEIEAVLRSHADVRSAVVNVQNLGAEPQLVGYVVPMSAQATQEKSAGPIDEMLSHWQEVFDRTYEQWAPEGPVEEDLNTAGWVDSITALPIAREPMRAWADAAAGRVLKGQPRRVLEVGVGTGMLLLRIAPKTSQYVGIDISARALGYVQTLAMARGLKNVALLHREAAELEQFEDGAYDCVVLNSVVQYFPSEGHLRKVLLAAVAKTTAQGRVFIGDVRSLPLLRSFFSETGIARDAGQQAGSLRAAVTELCEKEEELIVDPQYFIELAKTIPRVSRVELLLKEGHDSNEMVRFRYDVIWHVEAPSAMARTTALTWLDAAELPTCAALATHLREKKPPAVVVRGLQNARVSAAVRLVEALKRAPAEESGDALWQAAQAAAATAIDPARLVTTARQLGYEATALVSDSDTPAQFDLVCHLPGLLPVVDLPGSQLVDTHLTTTPDLFALTSHPLAAQRSAAQHAALKEFVAQRLPAYMVPAIFVTLPRLPLTSNGKVDRSALPPINTVAPTSAKLAAPPRLTLEFQLQQIWQTALQKPAIGIHDDFFSIGGNSLSAVRLMAQIKRQLHVNLPLSMLFEAPRISQLARRILASPPSNPAYALIPLQPEGTKPPFFCIHPAGGNVLCYRDMAQSFSPQRPLLCFESPPLLAQQAVPRSLPELAAFYITALQAHTPQGPYHLGGWSFGGIVAYEMACQLTSRGIPVASVTLFDSALLVPGDHDPRQVAAQRLLRMAAFLEMSFGLRVHLSYAELVVLPPQDQLDLFSRRLRQTGNEQDTTLADQILRFAAVFQDNLALLRPYRPKPYPGVVLLFRAAEKVGDKLADLEFPGDTPLLGWESVAVAQLQCRPACGNHLTMCSPPHVSSLTAELCDALDTLEATAAPK